MSMIARPPGPRFAALLSLIVAACASERAEPGGAASGSTASGAAAASAVPVVATSARASAARLPGSASARSASADDRKIFLRHLGEGRRLAQKKDFEAALKELDRALAVSPKDPRALAEVGWAAFGKRDLDRAKRATSAALANTSDPKLRAQALYTRGRAHQEAGDVAAAKQDYAESLTLRDNAEVAKRYAEVGGKPEEVIPPWSTCTEGAGTVADLCACLQKKADAILFLEGKTSCEPGPTLDLGDPRLSVVRLAREEIGYEAALILVAEDDKKLRAVAEVGREYEPGAFGVHNTAEVKGGRLVAKGAVAVVRHVQSNADSNLAGLELCEELTEVETLCVLGKGGAATRCPRSIPTLSTVGCGLGIEVDPAELGPEGAEEIARIKASASKKTTKLEWAIDDAGKLSVKVIEGDASMVPKALLTDVTLLR